MTGRFCARALLATTLGVMASGMAFASDEDANPPRRIGREIVLNLEKPIRPTAPNWLGGRVTLRKGAGVEYFRNVNMGRKNYKLSVYGPATQRAGKKKKRIGVGIELRF